VNPCIPSQYKLISNKNSTEEICKAKDVLTHQPMLNGNGRLRFIAARAKKNQRSPNPQSMRAHGRLTAWIISPANGLPSVSVLGNVLRQAFPKSRRLISCQSLLAESISMCNRKCLLTFEHYNHRVQEVRMQIQLPLWPVTCAGPNDGSTK
jgi:hypothetical protein